MSRKKEEKEEEKHEEDLLQELCGGDAKLYDFLSGSLYLNPLAGISEKGLDILIEEAERSGNFRPALDKAIFEATQNPGERERYIRVIQNLALKAIPAEEQEKEKAEKEGLADLAASHQRRIENHRFMGERTEDIINAASKFYAEKLVELGEDARREARRKERQRAESDERTTVELERVRREARKKEITDMGREEKREAQKQDKREELAAEQRKETRGEERKEAEREERRIGELEETEREARRRERRGD
jgi:hypothetical protein